MTNNSILPWLIFLIPALDSAAEAISGRKRPEQSGLYAGIGATLTFVLALIMGWQVWHGAKLVAWNGQLYVDGLGALMAVVVSTVGLGATIFSYRYMRHEVKVGKTTRERLPLYFSLIALFISTMVWAVITNNLIMLFVVVEATTLASALLVTFYWKRESLEAGYKYLLLCTIGITFALLGCVLIYAAATPHIGGHDAMLITAAATVASKFPRELTLLAMGFLVVGFGTKAGLVPFHAWLPDAHSQSPSPVSALLSGVSIKVAAYAMARVMTIFYPQYSGVALLLVMIGAVTMLAGIMFAFAQDDLKRMLAFSSVSQIGYVVMGLGIGTYLGFFGALYHLFNHALLKGMLFLCTGALLYTSGTTYISSLRGKENKNVLTAICFFIGALAIGGLPPLNGFWSKFTIFIAAAQAGLWWATGIAVFTSLLTLACLVRAGYLVFLERDDEHGEPDTGECASAPANPGFRLPLSMAGTMVLLAGISVGLGLYPPAISKLVELAAQSIMCAWGG